MRAVVVRAHGDVDRLVFEERPVPEPGPHQVLVRVAAAALNHLDIWVRRGIPGHPFPLPLVPGSDFAGVVERVGDGVQGLRPGDRVAGNPGHSCGACEACLSGRDPFCRDYGILGEDRDGACADYVAVGAANLNSVPPGMSLTEAAAVPLVFLTAWSMVVRRARVRPGETVLVLAAGSGVGHAAVQIARLWGARVLATVGGAAKAERARALGADEVIDHTRDDVLERVKGLTGRRGVDVVVEHVGAATWETSLRCLARGGRLVTCGATSGYEASTDLRLVFFKGLSILGSTMGAKGDLHEIWRHVAAGRLRPVVDRVYPLDAIREAHRHLEAREHFGKVVLDMGGRSS
ncbi:MAG: zinc-binding dehydrogenase [Planctomycetes bacterium]|nr:zinc-binding dehydrogenase [Planctomycetota bacterium]